MKYNRALDFLLAAVAFQRQGKLEQAAKAFTIASANPELDKVLSKLETHQEKAREIEKAALKKETAKAKPETRDSALAKHLVAIAAAKKKKPMPGFLKKKIEKKKKAKASEGDEFDSVVDDMTEASEGMDGMMDDDMGEDLSLDDINDALDDGEGVEEMPLASEGEDLDGQGVVDEDFLGDEEVIEASDDEESDDDEECASDDEDADDEDSDDEEEDKEESTPVVAKSKVASRMMRANANIQAISRLAQKAKGK
jgi:cobalamin biosynthesis protein CobT